MIEGTLIAESLCVGVRLDIQRFAGESGWSGVWMVYLRPASLATITISMGPPITRATSPLAS
jgi:hypothetical protein